MIIPIRCMGCGKPIADKWRFYQKKIAEIRADRGEQPIFLEGKESDPIITPEGEVLKALGVTRPCCRKHFLTHRDLIDKI
jgi:DNA-directed RNA polymerase subunit N (RpoN/RPB10)